MKIKLFNQFNQYVITRNKLREFFRDLNRLKENHVVLDFQNISFISRSCVDEYLQQKQKSTKNIKEINLAPKINFMINLVKEQQRTYPLYKLENYRERKSVVLNSL